MIPAPYVVGWRAWSAGGRDAHGNPTDSWADPVPVPVHAVAPRQQTEPADGNRNLVIEGLTLYAPAGTTVGEHDRVVWPHPGGAEYEVDGDVADWTAGPWPNPAAGVVINLTRMEG